MLAWDRATCWVRRVGCAVSGAFAATALRRFARAAGSMMMYLRLLMVCEEIAGSAGSAQGEKGALVGCEALKA